MQLLSVAEVNALIPRLEQIFEEIAGLRERARPLQEAIEQLDRQIRSNGVDHSAEQGALQRQLDALTTELTDLLGEIATLGGEVKDLDLGLVDFPHQRQGRIVYLCWRRGEDRVRFWHDLSAGFAGRQPLAEDER